MDTRPLAGKMWERVPRVKACCSKRRVTRQP